MQQEKKSFQVAGIDGTKQGWVVARGRWEGGKWYRLRAQLVSKLADAIDPNIDCYAIDMPMGFMPTAQPGGRQAEREARQLLTGKASTLFSSPCRPVLSAKDYPHALALSKQSSPHRIGLSKQSYHLLPKIRELDTLLRTQTDLRERFYEVHPELCFRAMCPERSLPSSKHSGDGLHMRRRRLARQGIHVDRYPKLFIRAAKEDDCLDAVACLWTAARIVTGTAVHVPEEIPTDEHGIRMALYY